MIFWFTVGADMDFGDFDFSVSSKFQSYEIFDWCWVAAAHGTQNFCSLLQKLNMGGGGGEGLDDDGADGEGGKLVIPSLRPYFHACNNDFLESGRQITVREWVSEFLMDCSVFWLQKMMILTTQKRRLKQKLHQQALVRPTKRPEAFFPECLFKLTAYFL